MDEKKKNVMDYVDNLLGEEGVKFDIKADLHSSNYLYLFAVITTAMVVGHLINITISKLVK